MKLADVLSTRKIVLGCLCAGALAAVACADGPGSPTSPSASAALSSVAATAPGEGALSATASFPRSGDIHLTKECSEYTGLAGSFCTISASNLEEIEVGSRVVYASARSATLVDSDVVIDPPGPGNNVAFGHVVLDRTDQRPACSRSRAEPASSPGSDAVLDISLVARPVFHLDGTYSFDPRD